MPDLSNNIKCGNSLIGPDFYDQTQLLFVDDEERIRINVFDWDKEFFEIMENGGFNVVIGNPPYIDSEEMVKSSPELREYCAKRYKTAKGNWDMYCVMSERGISLLNNNGIFGFIIPNKFLSAPYGLYLKRFFSKYSINNVLDYSSIPVFVSNVKKINVYPIIIIVSKNNKNRSGIYMKMLEQNSKDFAYQKEFSINTGETDWTLKFDLLEVLLQKIENISVPLSNYFNIESAATVSEAYEIKKILQESKKDDKGNFIFVNTGTIDRYSILWGFSKTTYIKNSYSNPVINKEKFLKLFPNRYKQAISEKLVLAGMVKRLEAIYDFGNIVAGKSTTLILKKENEYSLKYLLGLINSKLYTIIFTSKNKHVAMSGGYINVNQNQLYDFPFKEINFTNPSDKSHYDRMIELVDNILELHRKIVSVKTPDEKTIIQRQIDAIDNQIDKLIYELYGLTEEEIKIVEESVK
ncbi:MAG: hypothetical protein FJW56_11670 [Actinobacteria bacterium]|nr:hypothetical protein [Actinomycetota bacterium]